MTVKCRVRKKWAAVVGLYTHPPTRTTVICADELGPVIARTFPPAAGSPSARRRATPPAGDDRHHRPANYAASSCTAFEERCTKAAVV
jgi:hypothetical protein